MLELKSKDDLLAALVIVLVLVIFFLYYFTTGRKLLLNYFVRKIIPAGSKESLEFFSDKLTGIIITGILPFVLLILIIDLPLSKVGFVAGQTFKYWYLILSLILTTAIISFFMSKRRNIRNVSTGMRLDDWYPRHMVLSGSAWLFYAFGYEFLFRGALWFLCYDAFGFWPALMINLILYSLTHLPKGRIMVTGAPLPGLIYCLLSYLTSSFYSAFILHLSMALFSEAFSLYHNPDIRLHFIKTN